MRYFFQLTLPNLLRLSLALFKFNGGRSLDEEGLTTGVFSGDAVSESRLKSDILNISSYKKREISLIVCVNFRQVVSSLLEVRNERESGGG